MDSKRLTPIPPLTEVEETTSQEIEETEKSHLITQVSRLSLLTSLPFVITAEEVFEREDVQTAMALAQYIWEQRRHVAPAGKEIIFRGIGQLLSGTERQQVIHEFSFDFYLYCEDECEVFSIKTWDPERPFFALPRADDGLFENNWTQTSHRLAHWTHDELGEFVVMTEEETVQMATEYIQENVGHFNAWYIAQFTDVEEDVIEAIQNAEISDPSRAIGALIGDFNTFVRDAITIDGIQTFTYPDSGHDTFQFGVDTVYHVFRI